MNEEVEEKFERALSGDLGTLGVDGELSSKGGMNVSAWDLPEDDRRSLAVYGLPVRELDLGFEQVRLGGDIQEGVTPEIHLDDSVAYRLGTFWDWKIGAIAGRGVVLGFADNPETGPTFINSSVSAFVEVSWRWRIAANALHELGDREEDDEQLFASLERFRQHLALFDPELADDEKSEWWTGMCKNW